MSTARFHWSSWLFPLLLLVVISSLSELLYRLEVQRLEEVVTSQLVRDVATLRARIESELNPNLHITAGLVGYVSAHDLLEEDRVMTALRVLHRNARHIRNVALAPDNVIAYIYPLEGNEAALGLAYEQSPQQWPAVLQAMEKRQTVLTGPIDLVQGGRGLISRTPVFLEDDRYWGLLSVVLDSDSLFDAVGFQTVVNGVEFGLRWQADSLGETGEAVAGDESVFENDPVTVRIPVPGGAWELGAVPAVAAASGAVRLQFYRIGGYVLALLISVLMFYVLEVRRRVARMALVDQLTGLPNRRWYGRSVRRALQEAERNGEPVALVYIDLDGFKAVNDSLGHRVGDEVLNRVALRMKKALGQQDFLARIGGDEFVVVIEGAVDERKTLERMEPMVAAIREPIGGFRQPIRLDASLGVAVYPQDGSDEAALMAVADERMYASKAQRRELLAH